MGDGEDEEVINESLVGVGEKNKQELGSCVPMTLSKQYANEMQNNM